MYTKVIKHQNKCYIYYSKNGKILRYPTGVEISKQDFDEHGKIKQSFIKKDKIISSLQKKIEDFIYDYVTKEGFRPEIEKVKNIFNEAEEAERITTDNFIKYFEKFYDYKTEEFKRKGSMFSLKDYKSFENSTLNFQIYFDKELTLSDINEKTIKKYQDFLTLDHKSLREKGLKLPENTSGKLNPNTINKRIQVLKTFCQWLDKEEYLKYPNFLNHFSAKKSRVIKDFLTLKQVKEIQNHDFKNEWQNTIRDIFIFSCHTGLRWSDLIRIKEIEIIENKNITYLKGYAHKTMNTSGKEIIIPLTKTAKKILKKYDYDFNLKNSMNAMFNKDLKEMLQKEKILAVISKKDKTKPDTFVKETMYINDTISIHTARHTFVTNLVNSKAPLNVVMQMTGHTKLETLSRYVHVPDELTDEYVKIFEN